MDNTVDLTGLEGAGGGSFLPQSWVGKILGEIKL